MAGQPSRDLLRKFGCSLPEDGPACKDLCRQKQCPAMLTGKSFCVSSKSTHALAAFREHDALYGTSLAEDLEKELRSFTLRM